MRTVRQIAAEGRTVILISHKLEEVRSVADSVTVLRGGLVLRDISALDDRGLAALKRITLEVRPGEIVGIAGVAGNGQRELAQVVAGLRRPTGGRVFLGRRAGHGPRPRAEG